MKIHLEKFDCKNSVSDGEWQGLYSDESKTFKEVHHKKSSTPIGCGYIERESKNDYFHIFIHWHPTSSDMKKGKLFPVFLFESGMKVYPVKTEGWEVSIDTASERCTEFHENIDLVITELVEQLKKID